jgi:hypothetical protein
MITLYTFVVVVRMDLFASVERTALGKSFGIQPLRKKELPS